MTNKPRMAERLEQSGKPLDEHLRVQVSYELIRLLSEELYSSPAKAVEELVVNAWDADAGECRIYVPDIGGSVAAEAPSDLIAVFDTGHGMDEDGLRDLWHVGRSRKRDDDRREKPKRQQIGKFGIGKLATYAVAEQVTYISRTGGRTLGVGLDFTSFNETIEEQDIVPVEVAIIDTDSDRLARDHLFQSVARTLAQEPRDLLNHADKRWTLVILEQLKPDARRLTRAKLEWVLRTAMPLERDFRLYLNNDEIASVDEDQDWVVDFDVIEIDDERLARLNKRRPKAEQWRRNRRTRKLVSDVFSSGVSGRIRVAKESLYKPTAKRADLGRSHGFFVRVRDRLVNEDDPLFGRTQPLSYQAFNRLHAVVRADDLDRFLKAPREGVERTEETLIFEALLYSLFNQARERWEEIIRAIDEDSHKRRDGQRNYINPYLVEHPIADALVSRQATAGDGSLRAWSYLQAAANDTQTLELIQQLYGEVTATNRRSYIYAYDDLGPTEPVVLFDAEASKFTLNNEHPLVDEYADEPRSKALLEAVVTAESLLEIYLREADVPDEIITGLLARRDSLWRSLARERVHSPRHLASALRVAQVDPMDLEVALVAAVRPLGFTSVHFGGNTDDPDGIAFFHDGRRERKIILEAKSNAKSKAPDLTKLDFAGLFDHMEQAEGAEGCLLVAPAYPGGIAKLQDDAAADRRSDQQRISCWTVEDLARVVEASETRHITTAEVLDIVLTTFSPKEVHIAIEELMSRTPWTETELQAAALDEIISSIGTVTDADLTVGEIARLLARRPGFKDVTAKQTTAAVEALSFASSGLLHLSGSKRTIFVRASADALRARLAQVAGLDATAHRIGQFRATPDAGNED